jgi:hypothetical protein
MSVIRRSLAVLCGSLLAFAACSSSNSSSGGGCCAFGGVDAGEAVACICGSDSTSQAAGDPNTTVTYSGSTCTVTTAHSSPDSGNSESVAIRGGPLMAAAQCTTGAGAVTFSSSDVACCIFDGSPQSCLCSASATIMEAGGITVSFDAAACTLKTTDTAVGGGGVTVSTQGRRPTSGAECAATVLSLTQL